MPIEDDDFSRPSMGRVDEVEGRRLEALLRFRRRSGSGGAASGQARSASGRSKSHLLSDKALDTRIRKINLHDGRRGEEVIVKSTNGPPKTFGAVRGLVHYVARLNSSGDQKADLEPVPVFDGYGREIAQENLTAELASWNLFSNRENLSKNAREAVARGDGLAIREMSARARYRNVQAWHFIWSIHVGDDPDMNAERLWAAALITIERQFTEQGHRVLWAVHRDKEIDGRLHAHVVVEALSRNGDRIRCDKHGDYLYSMRVELASNLTSAGLDYIATCREDRYFLRQKILAGNEPLRRNLTMAQIKSGGGELSRRVPQWWGRFGEEAMENWERARKPKRKAVVALGLTHMAKRLRNRSLEKDRINITTPYKPIFDELAKTFVDPFDALELWHQMAREGGRLGGNGTAEHPNRRLAIWYLVNRPETFGRLRGDGRAIKTNKKLRRLLKRVSLPSFDNSHDPQAGTHRSWERTGARSISSIERDRSRVEASLLRVAQIAEGRGRRQSDVEDIRLRVQGDLKHVQIGSAPSFPIRRTAYSRPDGQSQKRNQTLPNPSDHQDGMGTNQPTDQLPSKTVSRRSNRER